MLLGHKTSKYENICKAIFILVNNVKDIRKENFEKILQIEFCKKQTDQPNV